MNNDVVIYQSSDGLVKMEAIVDASNETIWATQKAMAELFGVNVPAISKHLKNIYSEGELAESMTISKMETVVQRGFRGAVREMVEFYNLDAIISVGYRINSRQATAFRQWATSVLKQYMIKGYAVNQNAASEQKYEDLKRALGLLEKHFNDEHEKSLAFIKKSVAESGAKHIVVVAPDVTKNEKSALKPEPVMSKDL